MEYDFGSSLKCDHILREYDDNIMKLFCYHSTTSNKTYLILINKSYIYKYDIDKEKRIQFKCIEKFNKVRGFLDVSIDNIHGKIYIFTSNMFCIFDLENNQWNLIQDIQWKDSSIPINLISIVNNKTAPDQSNKINKTINQELMIKNQVYGESVEYDDNLDNILEQTTFHFMKQKNYTYYTLRVRSGKYKICRDIDKLKFIGTDTKLLFVKSLNRWYLITGDIKHKITVFYSDKFEFYDSKKKRKWIKWENNERHSYYWWSDEFDAVLIKSRIFLFHWKRGYIYCLDLMNEIITKHEKKININFSQSVACDEFNNNVYFAPKKGQIKVFKLIHLMPMEYCQRYMLYGYIREYETENHSNIPSPLSHIIASYFSTMIMSH